MSANESCYLCGRELNGALELKCFAFGKVVIVFLNGTEDCNWRQCKICGKPLCKRCYVIERSICSDKCFFGEIERRHSAKKVVPFAERVKNSAGPKSTGIPFGRTGSNGHSGAQQPSKTNDENKPIGGGNGRL